MPKRKTPELKPEEQFKRFQEAAEKLAIDKGEVERSFTRLSRPVEATDRKKKSRTTS
jgi:hypothetical protein